MASLSAAGHRRAAQRAPAADCKVTGGLFRPLGWALAALMRWPTRDRDEHRQACLRRIAEARPLDDARRFLLFNCVSTYLEWDGSAAEVEALLHGEREGQSMITWAEKVEARAEERGRRELLLEQLTTRFGALPPQVRERLAAIDSAAELSLLGRRLLSAGSLEELGLV